MTKNLNVLERFIRGIFGVGIIVLVLDSQMSTWLMLLLINMGSILIVTSLVGFSPIYEILSTRRTNLKRKTRYIS